MGFADKEVFITLHYITWWHPEISRFNEKINYVVQSSVMGFADEEVFVTLHYITLLTFAFTSAWC